MPNPLGRRVSVASIGVGSSARSRIEAPEAGLFGFYDTGCDNKLGTPIAARRFFDACEGVTRPLRTQAEWIGTAGGAVVVSAVGVAASTGVSRDGRGRNTTQRDIEKLIPVAAMIPITAAVSVCRAK